MGKKNHRSTRYIEYHTTNNQMCDIRQWNNVEHHIWRP